MKSMENMLLWLSVITLIALIVGIGFVVASTNAINETTVKTTNPF